jgi:hypothetical protein
MCHASADRERTGHSRLNSAMRMMLMLMSTLAHPQSAPWIGEPRLPGAVTKPPPWLKPAPFDIDAFLEVPRPDENAAPLYLDALFEFSDEVAVCFPAGQRGRSARAKQRWARLNALYSCWIQNEASVSPKQIEELLAELRGGLDKIAAAQQRERCVFASGIDYESLLPHGLVLRSVVRVLSMKTGLHLSRGDVDQAIDNHRIALRISRDIRPRGGSIVQLVSVAIDGTISHEMTSRVLTFPGITVDHCDRLLALWNAHESSALDAWDTGIKFEYVLLRQLLHLVETGQAQDVDESGGIRERALEKREVARYLNRIAVSTKALQAEGQEPDGKDAQLLNVTQSLARYLAVHFRFDHGTLDDFARTFLGLRPPIYQTRVDEFSAFTERRLMNEPGLDPPFLIKVFMPSISLFAATCANDALYLRAAKCRVAIRRWQLTHDGHNSGLLTMCRAAGLNDVPIDPYSGNALKMAVIAGEPVVYSVGQDGHDDDGQKDAILGRKPEGDYLFPLPNLKDRTIK